MSKKKRRKRLKKLLRGNGPADLLVRMLRAHHDELYRHGSQEVKEAIILKCVCMLVLAFGLPAMRGQPVDYDEALEKLARAMMVIAKAEGMETTEIEAPKTRH